MSDEFGERMEKIERRIFPQDCSDFNLMKKYGDIMVEVDDDKNSDFIVVRVLNVESDYKARGLMNRKKGNLNFDLQVLIRGLVTEANLFKKKRKL